MVMLCVGYTSYLFSSACVFLFVQDILSMGRYALLRKIERIAQSDNKATTQQDGALGYSCSQKRSEDTAFWQFRYRYL